MRRQGVGPHQTSVRNGGAQSVASDELVGVGGGGGDHYGLPALNVEMTHRCAIAIKQRCAHPAVGLDPREAVLVNGLVADALRDAEVVQAHAGGDERGASIEAHTQGAVQDSPPKMR